MKLTEKQKAFCDYYIETLNATESYKRAGYKVKSEDAANAAASRMLRNVKVRKYIEERMKQKESERIASQDEVLEFLTRVMRGQETEEVVGFTESGPVKEKKAPSTKDRVKAAELLGKRYALFTEKVNVSGNMGVVIVDDIKADDSDED
ncbi:phage terminase small subunit [Carboxydocella sporoproducens DSM 16521]|uniref:Phage terminase small subunit n=2 Tax=Carboxydocella TaxID=178898 RepID=A0A1T4QF82_9FIRM|nr:MULTISPECIES: terminase small subunit [Carboxydocella]AVX21608.1 phage terminase small subunit [Carboxydocella thermautotrophica]SKA02257.1 phage terminase small subunit [Carboxydocella sporoproducens DSM 16521]